MPTLLQRTARIAEKHPVSAAALTVARLVRGDSFLIRTGWWTSALTHRAVDGKGQPVPWYTYAAIAFLEARVPSDAQVFEYGSGHSTLWWAARAARVVSVESDAAWQAEMQPRLPAHCEYHLQPLDDQGSYPRAIGRAGGPFDIIVNDGWQRVACARELLAALTPRGVVVWDNSDRARYAEGYALLAEHGFRRLDFHGVGPINTDAWCTSVFYREGNLLGI